MIASGVLLSLLIILLVISPSFAAGLVLFCLAGVAATLFSTIIAPQLQLLSPNELRGRVMSLYAITSSGRPRLGPLASARMEHLWAALPAPPKRWQWAAQ